MKEKSWKKLGETRLLVWRHEQDIGRQAWNILNHRELKLVLSGWMEPLVLFDHCEEGVFCATLWNMKNRS